MGEDCTRSNKKLDWLHAQSKQNLITCTVLLRARWALRVVPSDEHVSGRRKSERRSKTG